MHLEDVHPQGSNDQIYLSVTVKMIANFDIAKVHTAIANLRKGLDKRMNR